MVDEKRCPRCNTVRPQADFYRSGNTIDGLATYCRSCVSKANKIRAEVNRQKNANGVTFAPGATKHCGKCKQTLPVTSFQKNQTTRDGLQSMCRECYRPLWRAARQKRIDTSPKHKIDSNMRANLGNALKRGNNAQKAFDALGYTKAELKAHLISTLPDGFTWDDYLTGTLAIDHIRARCLFRYESTFDPVFRECWALKNLRLLPHGANALKQREDQLQKRQLAGATR